MFMYVSRNFWKILRLWAFRFGIQIVQGVPYNVLECIIIQRNKTLVNIRYVHNVLVSFRWFENLKTDADWEYYTEPQENACLSFEGNVSMH